MMNATLNSMTVQDFLNLPKFIELAKEAQEAEHLIKNAFSNSFGIEKNEIHVYHVTRHGEYCGDATLGVDGIWRYSDNWGGGRTWTIRVDADSIFKMLKAAYLVETKQTESTADIPVQYFRKFIKEIKIRLSNG